MGPPQHPPKQFLFVLWAGGGNVPPQLALARRLIERGHRVSVLAPHVLKPAIETAGCAFLPLRAAPDHNSASQSDDPLKDWDTRTPIEAAARVRDNLIFGTAQAYYSDVTAAIDAARPDVIATDYLLLGAYVAAERAHLPLAALVHTVYPLPAPGMPPYGMGFQPAKGVLGRARDALFAQIFQRFYNARLEDLNRVRAHAGLAPLTSAFQQFYGASRLLVLTSPAFDFPATSLPANVRYVGPQIDDPAWGQAWTMPITLDERRPLVLVSLSTTYQRQEDVLRRVIAALADLPVQGLVTLGPALNQQDFALPPNVIAETYIPHTLVCPRADVVVTHGGLGTITAALAYGKPLVCIPMGRDQGDNAARVTYRGAGVICSRKASAEQLRQAIRRTLEEPSFRQSAQRLAADIARDGGPTVAIEEMERLAAGAVHAPGQAPASSR
ncbi:MAG TPA: nucleotide disphospho-sugar-binding domain-containing protein [Ktedonobacterales bacterium]|nr:nucleotide disphospho-sugar-binding domain-containing protein [Ktedonobacterales bacterium]